MSSKINPISATAGAIPFVNEKGQISMKTVKVNRYVAGKVPDYCLDEYDERNEEFDDEDDLNKVFPDRQNTTKKVEHEENYISSEDNDDDEDIDDDRLRRLRKKTTFQVVDDSDSEAEDVYTKHLRESRQKNQLDASMGDTGAGIQSDGEDQIDEEDEEERLKRRQAIREKALAAAVKNDLNDIQGEIPPALFGDNDGDDEDYVVYSDEEESDSDQEKEPKIKPVFVAANQRRTINKTQDEINKEVEKEKLRQKEEEAIKRQKRKIIEDMKKEDLQEKKQKYEIDTDGEDPDVEYEKWRIREMKRVRQDLDEREQRKRDAEEVARIRGMTEDERLEEFKKNPKKITNAIPKGKMKFMQRYHHRGAFYVQELEDSVYQRDFTQPTLEDQFNVANLPKIRQVKNFGRAGRTKYTHLVDVDTTDITAGWANENMTRFHNNKAGGMKQQFEKPAASSRK